MGWASGSDEGHKKAHTILIMETVGKGTLEDREENWKDNIKTVFSEQRCENEGLTELNRDLVQWRLGTGNFEYSGPATRTLAGD
jgi:hypothetical protein